MPTDSTVNNLIINKLTKAQYDEIQNPSETELYLVPDEIDSIPTSGSENPVTSDGIYTALQDKTDKVTNATSGNFAGLDNNGNLTDSGSKASDFATAAQGALAATAVQNVTVDGTSIVSSGTAAIVTMTTTELNTLWNSL